MKERIGNLGDSIDDYCSEFSYNIDKKTGKRKTVDFQGEKKECLYLKDKIEGKRKKSGWINNYH